MYDWLEQINKISCSDRNTILLFVLDNLVGRGVLKLFELLDFYWDILIAYKVSEQSTYIAPFVIEEVVELHKMEELIYFFWEK